MPRIAALVAALGRHVAGIEPLPPIDWRFETTAAGGAECVVACETPPERVTLWTAASESRDFRMARWSSEPVAVSASGSEWRVALQRPTNGFTAGLVELEFAREPVPLVLTSGVKVLRAT
jgi:PhoPQ-activated pathogenicity-related protein